MIDQIERIQRDGVVSITAAPDLEALRAVETSVLGKKAELSLLKKQFGGLDDEGRKAAGQALKLAVDALESAVAERRAHLVAEERTRQYADERLDLTEITEHARRGHLHLVTQTRDRLE